MLPRVAVDWRWSVIPWESVVNKSCESDFRLAEKLQCWSYLEGSPARPVGVDRKHTHYTEEPIIVMEETPKSRLAFIQQGTK